MKTKKFAIALLCFIAILLVILLLKMNSTKPTLQQAEHSPSQYSSNDIKELILKGSETLAASDNLYYEEHSEVTIDKYYYTKRRSKHEIYIIPSSKTNVTTEKLSMTFIRDFTELKYYIFDHSNHTVKTQDENPNDVYYAFQGLITLQLKNQDSYRHEFTYLKDEKIDEEDCIVAKQSIYDASTNEPREFNLASIYWIEKSTGFVLASSDIPKEDTTCSPSIITKNISFGTVKDTDLLKPSGL